eukprot:CAMPEP_0174363154 /NCGR_PEP_ID=MMETSP0811_2-20130205/67560_1 /TAXON_ID=73025 ORGANISM="Eutreptiella gymnastica-like, Strain CCMP1594" /NCGR_SAMPLE_ID=MMETSP0811_2 /ASSEMBLY_ACC=CAM_ASM_000667 /LENGTH=59 /DNA_ID=CAMNT_0015501543 /DNA_START=40 /DNA_END=216 /DNA_ORIENTATION=+
MTGAGLKQTKSILLTPSMVLSDAMKPDHHYTGHEMQLVLVIEARSHGFRTRCDSNEISF